MGDPPGLLEVAERALAARFGPVTVELRPAALSGSDRSTVVRARVKTVDAEMAVVLKAPTGAEPGAVREEAALRVAARLGLPGPVRLLASSVDPPLLVLTDAGSGPTLADRLLAPDADAAEAALLRWAASLGRLQAASAGCRAAFEQELSALSPFGAPPADTTDDDLAAAAVSLERDLRRLAVAPTAAALDELRHASGSLVTAASGLVPGDTCPDNAVDTPDGVVLLDFEAACHRHVAREAAYLTVPWPSCWCSWRLPDDVTEGALAAWRAAVAPALSTGPASAADLDTDLARTTIAWALLSTSWLLPSALDGDPPSRDPARQGLVPTRRAMIQHRLECAAACDTPVFPAMRALAEQVHAATLAVWGRHELALAPAFR